MGVYVKMQQSKLKICEAKSTFDLLPLKPGSHDSSRLLPYHSSLAEALSVDSAVKTNISCRICEKSIERKKMRQHVGAHILRDNLKNACGFCGQEGCDIEIARVSGRGQTASEIPKSTCAYFEEFSIKAASKG